MSDLSWQLRPLPWQNQEWRQVGKALEEERLPHALLIVGSAGIGKTHMAEALAALLLCHQPTVGTACERCKSCDLLQAGTHADLLDIALEESSRIIKVDQIRALTNFAGKTASLGRRKIVLLRDADCMNLNAANALLKNLEEPGADTHFILVADNLSQLAPTVRSRCQNLSLTDPGEDACSQWLLQICGDQDVVAALLSASRGKPMTAAKLYTEDKLQQHQTIEQGLDALLVGKISPLEFPQWVPDHALEEVVGILSGRLEAIIRKKIDQGERQLAPQFCALDDLQLLRRRISSGANPNRQLCIESAAMQLVEVLGGQL